MIKEMWIDEFDRLYAEKLDAGMSDMKASEQAANEADGAVAERLADLADRERTRRKEGAALIRFVMFGDEP